jgi:hypothetical protein
VPPDVASVRVIVEAWQTTDAPTIATGLALTVTGVVAIQPVPSEYEIVQTPTDIPVTTPVKEPTVAIPVLLLLHTPPPGSDSVVVKPIQTRLVPVIGAGAEITVTDKVAAQPVDKL